MTEEEIEAIREKARRLAAPLVEHLQSKPGGLTEEDIEGLTQLIRSSQKLAQLGEEEMTRRGMLSGVDLNPEKPKN